MFPAWSVAVTSKKYVVFGVRPFSVSPWVRPNPPTPVAFGGVVVPYRIELVAASLVSQSILAELCVTLDVLMAEMTGGVSSIVAVAVFVPGGLASSYVTLIVPPFTTLSRLSPGLLAADVSWMEPKNTPEAFPTSVVVTVSPSPVSLVTPTVAVPLRSLSMSTRPASADDMKVPWFQNTLPTGVGPPP